MTVDDENSIYVGGLSHDCTEDTLRRVFHLYGFIVAVKIINGLGGGGGGKCYGFVTFRNPRSALNAIKEMDGKKIDGRIVKVNDVKTRGERPSFNRNNFQRNNDRGMEWNRNRNIERNYDHDRGRYQDRDSDRSRERDRDRGRDRSGDREERKERGHERTFDHYRERDRFLDRDQDQNKDLEDNEREHSGEYEQKSNRDPDGHWVPDSVSDRIKDYGKIGDERDDQLSKKQNSINYSGFHNREQSSDSSGRYRDQLASKIQRCEELQNEISQCEDKLEDKQKLVLDLQEKAQKLEDALTTAKKLSSLRQMQLTKLHQFVMQVKDYSGKLKRCEQELQDLVDTTMMELDFDKDTGLRNVAIANGSA